MLLGFTILVPQVIKSREALQRVRGANPELFSSFFSCHQSFVGRRLSLPLAMTRFPAALLILISAWLKTPTFSGDFCCEERKEKRRWSSSETWTALWANLRWPCSASSVGFGWYSVMMKKEKKKMKDSYNLTEDTGKQKMKVPVAQIWPDNLRHGT